MAKKVDYFGAKLQFQPTPKIIHHPPVSMKPRPVLGKQNYSSEQQQKG
jgi:hypothetical protein